MSVEVKTPSPAQFEHVEFPCGQKTLQNKPTESKVEMTAQVKVSANLGKKDDNQEELFLRPDKQCPQQGKKRRASDIVNKNLPPAKRRFSQSGQRGKGKAPVLPTKFLLGGNINDPLNLNSLNDQEINKAMNAKTPQSSPLPTPSHRQQVHVLIPPNVKDPLNLNIADDGDVPPPLLSPKMANKKKKRHHKKRKSSDVNANQEDGTSGGGNEGNEASRPSCLSVIIPDGCDATKSASGKIMNVIDQIVSPVIPQTSPKWKRKRTASECKSEKEKGGSSAVTTPVEESKPPKPLKSPVKNKQRKSLMSQIGAVNQGKPKPSKTFRSKDEQFIYGNYNRYYGKRNPGEEHDNRLKCFHKDWLDHKDALDIGCNIGHITLSIARDFQPKKIVGLDIDGKLISIARKNVRYYLSDMMPETDKFPISLKIVHGPIAAPNLHDDDETTFPNNVSFVQGNYVLENDDLLETVREEYDCILALSISKWVHLNHGDAGIKRFFKRAFRQLRPGGKFILEPQTWISYKKKKKLTETIFKHYQSIRFRPEHFTEYLLSKEVGFITCDLIDLPYNKSKGFQRPIQVYTKADTSYTTPREITESRGVTPLMEINCTPHFDCPSFSRNNTPRFDRYSGYTPSSDRATPSYAMWSSNATPRIDYDSRGATPGHQSGGADSRGATPHHPGTPGQANVDAASTTTSSRGHGHKYTFVSGDPRGTTPAYACDSRGGTPPVHGSNSRSGTPVKLEGEGKEDAAVDDVHSSEMEKTGADVMETNAVLSSDNQEVAKESSECNDRQKELNSQKSVDGQEQSSIGDTESKTVVETSDLQSRDQSSGDSQSIESTMESSQITSKDSQDTKTTEETTESCSSTSQAISSESVESDLQSSQSQT